MELLAASEVVVSLPHSDAGVLSPVAPADVLVPDDGLEVLRVLVGGQGLFA